jgi:HD-GYP domain-containing protein (c-di-GMP phosphodiesterase class II)
MTTTTATTDVRRPRRPAGDPRLPEAGGLGVLARRYFAHDVEGWRHARNVARLSVDLARGFSLSREDLVALAVGATLHDIGKLMVPAAVLETPGELTSDEWGLVRTHPECGELLVSAHVCHPIVRSVIRWHHERVDGSGYPDGLRGAEIPLAARIVAVADAYEAIVATRPYSVARPPAVALAEIADRAGSQFDGECARGLAEIERKGRQGRVRACAGR